MTNKLFDTLKNFSKGEMANWLYYNFISKYYPRHCRFCPIAKGNYKLCPVRQGIGNCKEETEKFLSQSV